MSKKRRKKSNWPQKQQKVRTEKTAMLLDTTGQIPAIKYEQVMKALNRGEHEVISHAILTILKFYTENTLQSLDEVSLRNLNTFVSTVFAVFMHSGFKIPQKHAEIFVANTHIFANVVATSNYETTDAPLQVVLAQPNNIVKVCFLYSVRNKLQLPLKNFFDANPVLASRWYTSALAAPSSPTTSRLLKNMHRFYQEVDERLVIFEDSCHINYFASSYLDGNVDIQYKPFVNRACKRQLTKWEPKNTPNKNKIAVVTSKWFANSAVRKSAEPLIKRLFVKYHVTLIHTGPIPKTLSTDGFDDVIYLKDVGFEGLQANDFQMIYYCDIGMTPESVLLSNTRLAPIQVMSYGHPSSTFGGEIDYFIGGEDVECVEKADSYFSERLVLIPGMGCLASYPNYKRTYPEKDHEEVIIQCVHGPDKYHYDNLMVMKRAFDRFTKPAKLHIYPSQSINRNNALIPFLRDLHELFGNNLVPWTQFEYHDYMKNAEANSDMALNSLPPFGGFNTVVEAMYLDIPTLHCNGDNFRTMVGGVLNDRIGMSDWNTSTPQEFEDRLVEIVNTGEWREKKKQLEEMDLKKAIFSGDEPEWFEKAIDYLMENGDREEVKKDRTPLIVREVV